MNKNVIIAAVIVVVLIVGYFIVTSGSSPSATIPPPGTASSTSQMPVDTATSASPSMPPSAGSSTIPSGATVTYTDTGFSPAVITVSKGQAVTFINKSSRRMWVASDPHPAHDNYDGTSGSQHCAAGYTGAAPFDQCSAGDSFTFTFDKAGKWGYHNHAAHQDQATVIVK